MIAQNYATKTKKANDALGKLLNGAVNASEPMKRMMDELLINKRAIYIEDTEWIGSKLHVEYCHEWTLNNGNPDWADVQIPRTHLVKYILDNELNKWERHYMKGGEIAIEDVSSDAETCLLEMDDTDLKYMVREYMEKILKA